MIASARYQAQSTEKALAPHSSTLAWQIPWMEEPGRLQSMGSLGVRHDWRTSISLFTFIHWRRKWQPTPVFLPGESQGRGSLVGCRLWGRTESDTTEAAAAAGTKWSEICSVVSNSLWPHGLYNPWNSLGQNTGVGSLSLLQIFQTQVSSITGGFFISWATSEAQEYWSG